MPSISCFFSPLRFHKTTRNKKIKSMVKSSSFELLPLEIQETIFSFLPISTLIICTAVSRSFRSTIRSQWFTSSYSRSQPLFSFYSEKSIHNTYDPDLDRWFSLPLPRDLCQIHSDSVPFHFLGLYYRYLLFDPFVDLKNIAPADFIIVSEAPIYTYMSSVVAISMSNKSPKSFKLLAVNIDRTSILIYDSRTKDWAELVKTACHDVYFSYPAVYFHAADDILFYLSHDKLVKFDFTSRTREYLTERLPIDSQRYLFGVENRLFLAGGNSQSSRLINIAIWEFNFLTKEWSFHCSLPQDMFAEFSEGIRIQIVDRKGILCFRDIKVHDGSSILICDVLRKKWWWPKGFERGKVSTSYTHCLAVEPYIDLVKAGN